MWFLERDSKVLIKAVKLGSLCSRTPVLRQLSLLEGTEKECSVSVGIGELEKVASPSWASGRC